MFRLFCTSTLFITICIVSKADTIICTPNSDHYLIGEQLLIKELDSKDDNTSKIIRTKDAAPNFGITSNKYLVEMTLFSEVTTNKVLQIETSDILSLKITTESARGNNYSFTGENLNQYRDYFNNFKISLKPFDYTNIKIIITPNGKLQIPINILSNETFHEERITRHIWVSLFIGVFLVMILYNLFIYISTRNPVYGLYVLYIVALFLTQSALIGAYQSYFPLFGGTFNKYCIHVFTAISAITGTIFASRFLGIKNNFSRLYPGVYIIYIGYTICLVLSLLDYQAISHQFLATMGGFSSLYLFVVALNLTVRGFRQARFFLIAWLTFLVGLFIYILRDLGLVPYSQITTYTIPVGSALETILLSFALADRINTLKKEKEESQVKMYEEMKKNRDIMRNQKDQLEKMVQERTRVLELTNSDLESTLKHLKNTQSQLVDAEKMASLGQLTAGIAHEINNPINFVSSNIAPLKQDLNEIIDILQKYRGHALNPDESNLTSLEKEYQEVDINYNIDEIRDLINGIEEGATRTSAIINSLRTFSRADNQEFQKANINEGLESTLILLKSETRNINIEMNLGDIPNILCYPGKLNQVYMNVIDNAIHAIKDKHGKSDNGILNIRTTSDTKNIIIEITDNGAGIPSDRVNNIFDPFYTTKDVGEGTGLGLSISYGIIESHEGTISVSDTSPQGTTFKISIPIK